jgi:hypothetical protein
MAILHSLEWQTWVTGAQLDFSIFNEDKPKPMFLCFYIGSPIWIYLTLWFAQSWYSVTLLHHWFEKDLQWGR